MARACVLVRGGLGNQMFQVAYGMALAQRYGLDVRYVDFAQDARVKRDWGLSVFGVQRSLLSKLSWQIYRCVVILVRRLQSYLQTTMTWGVLVEPAKGGAVAWPAKGPRLVDGYWQQVSYYEAMVQPLRQRFLVDLGHYGEQLQVLRSWGRPIVAMHARRGDYVSDPAAAMHLVCDVAYYRRAWDAIRTGLDNPVLLVFSDDLAWARQHLDFAADTQFSSGEVGQPAWVDMMRMARCDHFIISNSSYSWWAAFLSEAPGKQVIAPRHWLRGVPTDTVGICPADWQLI